jgi:hypothetical protein
MQIGAVTVIFRPRRFGKDSSALPESPADLPGYKALLPQFRDEALKIVYVI